MICHAGQPVANDPSISQTERCILNNLYDFSTKIIKKYVEERGYFGDESKWEK